MILIFINTFNRKKMKICRQGFVISENKILSNKDKTINFYFKNHCGRDTTSIYTKGDILSHSTQKLIDKLCQPKYIQCFSDKINLIILNHKSNIPRFLDVIVRLNKPWQPLTGRQVDFKRNFTSNKTAIRLSANIMSKNNTVENSRDQQLKQTLQILLRYNIISLCI